VESARLAVAADVDRISELWTAAEEELGQQRGGALLFRSVSPRPGHVQPFDELLGDPDRVLAVGAIDEVVVGFGYAKVTTLQEHRGSLGEPAGAGGDLLGVVEVMYVEPEGRGVGVGEAILSTLVRRLGSLGCVGFDAFALPGNREAKAFFETQGFVTRLLVMHHVGAVEDIGD
jgi:GNAT superfamily N-acetyltransferase